MKRYYWRNFMNTTADKVTKEKETVAVAVRAEGRTIIVELYDGRTVSFPADRYKILHKAKDHELRPVTLRAGGTALRWENLDEDLTVEGIVAGRFQL